jgi:hypothetical protein
MNLPLLPSDPFYLLIINIVNICDLRSHNQTIDQCIDGITRSIADAMERHAGKQAAGAFTHPAHDQAADAGENNWGEIELELGLIEAYTMDQAKKDAADDPTPTDAGTQDFPWRAEGTIEQRQ